jgi:hypothetical protein
MSILNYSKWKSLNESAVLTSNVDIEKGVDFANKLINRGFEPIDAAAIAGNLWIESHFNPAAMLGSTNRKFEESIEKERNAAQETKSTYGLMQWRSDRKIALVKYSKEKGVHPANMKFQADFMKYELLDGYDGEYKYETTMFKRAMNHGDTVRKKAEGFAKYSERSGHIDPNRLSAAETIFKNL